MPDHDQLAADQTGDATCAAATGFLTLGRRYLNNPPDIINDRIDVVTRGLLGMTVAYAGTRLQFGRPIGSFQAVKHRCADMLVRVEHARSTAYHAAWAMSDGSDDADLAVSVAQAVCSEAYREVALAAVQLHGGIGFTWEHPAHLYVKRAVTDAALLGSAEWHRDRIALLVLDGAQSRSVTVTVATG